MPAFCSVIGCSKRAQRDKVSFFRIPTALKDRPEYLNSSSRKRRESWVMALRREKLSETFLKNARICSRHFITGKPASLEDINSPDWVPSLNMGYTTSEVHKTMEISLQDPTVNSGPIVNSGKRLRMDDSDDHSKPAGSTADSMNEADQQEQAEVDSPEQERVAVKTDSDTNHLKKLFKDLNFCNSKMDLIVEKCTKTDYISEETDVYRDIQCVQKRMKQMETLFKMYLSKKRLIS